MFSFSRSSDASSDDFIFDSRTIRFNEKSTVITDRRRKTLRTPKIRMVQSTDGNEDPELEEILCMSSVDIYPKQCQLSRLIGLVMACILDDAAESCCIMSKTFGLPDINLNMTQKSLTERNALLRSHSTIFNPETMEDYTKTQNSTMIRKLHEDIVFLQNILTKGVKNLLSDNNYHPWLMYIGNYDLQLEQDSKLLEMVEAKNTKLQELMEEFRSDKKKFQIDSEELSLAIGRARDEMEDFIIQAEIKKVYLNSWEKSRREQNVRKKEAAEDKYQEKLATTRKNTRRENRVHSEFEAFMLEYFKDTEDAIQDWITNYDNDMETKDEDITKTEFKIEALQNELTELEEKYNKRTEEIKDWLEKKAEKQRIEEELKFLNRMATIIQAWWRGTMVRRKLGPYRPKSKKKNKKKNKKKK